MFAVVGKDKFIFIRNDHFKIIPSKNIKTKISLSKKIKCFLYTKDILDKPQINS